MDILEEKHIDTSRGFHYRYYVSAASQADSSKPAIILCHGWPDGALLWRDVIPHLLKSKQRLIVPDLLGYGGTSKPTDPKHYEISAMVADTMEILAAEKITSEIIPMGHDWGSYFAQRVYLCHPERMAGLVTLNVAFMVPNPQPFDFRALNDATESQIGYPIYAYWELFADPEGPKIMDQHLDSVWHACHGDSDVWMKTLFCVRGAMREWMSQGRTDVELKPYAQDGKLKEEWMSMTREGGLTAPGCWYRAMAENYNFETEKKLPGVVEKPYLFIGCDGDAVCRTDFIEASKQAGAVKDLEVHELHSGHWCPYEKPDELGGLILEWLKKKGFAGS